MKGHEQVASVVAQVTEERWGQVLQTPHAYGVVEMYSPEGRARLRGIQILTELTKAFDEPPVSLSGLFDIADSLARYHDVVSLILLVPVGETIYIVSRGQGNVYLKRGNALALLLDSPRAISGSVKRGDVVIAATSGFIRSLSAEEITGVFDHLPPADVAEKLTMKLHTKETGEGGAALIFQVSEEERDAEAESATPNAAAEALQAPVPTARTIFFRRAKSMGRKVTTPRQRILLRKALAFSRSHREITPKRLVMYAVIGLFAVSVILGIRRQQLSKARSTLSGVIAESQHAQDEGMALMDLNPVKGRERLTQARDMLAPIVARKQKTDDARRAEALYKEVSDNLKRAMRIYRIRPELFFDVSLIKAGASVNDMSRFEDTLGMLDIGGKTVFSASTGSSGGQIAGGGPAISGAKHVAAYGDTLYVWTPDGIAAVRLTDQKTVPQVIPKSTEWGTISDMAAFGGNLYLLDTVKSRIWKYVAAEKGFSDIYEYLNPDTLPDLSRTVNMSIDGSVWLGTTNGQILRFTQGKVNTFTPQGMDSPLGNMLEVYTGDSEKMVYVLDSDNRRVVVFDKDGLYMAQYVWDNAFPVSEILVSESARKLFFLSDGKIYDTELF